MMKGNSTRVPIKACLSIAHQHKKSHHLILRSSILTSSQRPSKSMAKSDHSPMLQRTEATCHQRRVKRSSSRQRRLSVAQMP